MLADYKITLLDILKVSIPSTFIACMIAAFVASKMGKELNEDPEYLKRLKEGMIPKLEEKAFVGVKGAKLSVILFLVGTFLVVLLGSFEALRPGWIVDGKLARLSMPNTIEMVMLTIAALIIIFCKPNVESIVSGNVFKAGQQQLLLFSVSLGWEILSLTET